MEFDMLIIEQYDRQIERHRAHDGNPCDNLPPCKQHHRAEKQTRERYQKTVFAAVFIRNIKLVEHAVIRELDDPFQIEQRQKREQELHRQNKIVNNCTVVGTPSE